MSSHAERSLGVAKVFASTITCKPLRGSHLMDILAMSIKNDIKFVKTGRQRQGSFKLNNDLTAHC